MIKGPYWAYMVQCKYGTFYAGWTNNLTKRLVSHNEGKGAKYLRGKAPVKLIYKKRFTSALKAQAHERAIKKLSRTKKEAMILAYKVKFHEKTC